MTTTTHKRTHKLTAIEVSKKAKPGYYGDGLGLYLQVSKSGTKSWIFKFTLNGKAREMGLGPVHTVTLAEAREKAKECRKLLLDGIDPIEARRASEAAKRADSAKIMTFDECAKAYIKAHRASWRNAKHADQWTNSLQTYAGPVFGSLPVAAVDTALVMKCLDPIWREKAETASRLRGRIESVLDWATVRGYRNGENPARWRGHLDKLLPKRSKIATVAHHPALPYAEIGAFMAELRQQEGIAARALEFTILTATRTGEVIGAKWDELDLDNGLWIVPAERMKARKEHRVPLSEAAQAIIRQMQDQKLNEFVFPGTRLGKPISNMAMLKTLERMGRNGITVHGFRSTFRDWAAETTAYPSEVVEMALAHVVDNKVEAAYRRGDLFVKRQRLMIEWAKYCAKTGAAEKGKVVALKG